jgi:NDP-sugar pyrophosphorylase family protein
MRIEQAFHKQGFPALMTVLRNENRWDRSNVWLEGERIRVYSKKAPRPEMKHIDYGLGVLSAELFDDLRLGEAFDLAELYERLAEEGRLGCFEVTTRFYEIGSVDGLRETHVMLEERSK